VFVPLLLESSLQCPTVPFVSRNLRPEPVEAFLALAHGEHVTSALHDRDVALRKYALASVCVSRYGRSVALHSTQRDPPRGEIAKLTCFNMFDKLVCREVPCLRCPSLPWSDPRVLSQYLMLLATLRGAACALALESTHMTSTVKYNCKVRSASRTCTFTVVGKNVKSFGTCSVAPFPAPLTIVLQEDQSSPQTFIRARLHRVRVVPAVGRTSHTMVLNHAGVV
jgi:hypothetical protein